MQFNSYIYYKYAYFEKNESNISKQILRTYP